MQRPVLALRTPDGAMLATVPDEPVEIIIEPESPVAVVRVSLFVEAIEGALWLLPSSQDRDEKATSSVSGDVAAEGPASSRGNGDEATEEVHPAAGRPDSCRSCGAGCGAGLASRSCAGPAHPTTNDALDGGEA
ncbi:hypothetical protein [Actinomyces ruminicola]|uniref:hypothetical protein n=1 Tax=Actinomyces ruminicola TaxID=332524 RepID=UPI0011C89EA4|nr:hypothetical protein [Actinomyces ruminicola]